jgi:hypothetical protein
MDHRLESMWTTINETLFEGKLLPLVSVDWGETSGADGIGAHGKFFPKSRCIVIDEKFKFDEDKIREGNKKEEVKAEVAYRLLIHEMIHQSLHQNDAQLPGQHGEAFLAEAQRIAPLLGIEIPTGKVERWPWI